MADVNVIEFAAGISPTELRVGQSFSAFVIYLDATGQEITLQSWLTSANARNDRVTFADGTIWTWNDIFAIFLVPTNGDDGITGDGTDNTLRGELPGTMTFPARAAPTGYSAMPATTGLTGGLAPIVLPRTGE